MTIAERKEECWKKEMEWYGFFPRIFENVYIRKIGPPTQYDSPQEFKLGGYKVHYNRDNGCLFIWHNGKDIWNNRDYAELCLLRPIMADLCEEAANIYLKKEVEELEGQEALCEVLFDD